MRKRILVIALCAAMLAIGAAATFAYFTDQDAATNTFTVGKVDIKLDEAKANTDGTLVEGADRVQSNEYKLIPGHTYAKDPMVTVLEGSEAAYVRMLVTVNFSSQLDAIFASTGANLTAIFDGYNPDNWKLQKVTEDTDKNTRTYEFRYVGIDNVGTAAGTVKKADSDIKLDALFDKIVVPGSITKEQLATLVTKDKEGKITDQLKITVVAHAIQADGFDTADKAWAAFDESKKN